MDGKDVLLESFERLPALVRAAVHGLTPEQLRWAPGPGANTIAWLAWHIARGQDAQIADLIGDADDQIYLSGDWAPRFGLKADPGDNGYGHSASDVAAVQPESAQVLVDYYQAVHERTIAYVRGLSDADLDEIVDDRWDPPVTRGVRLVSVVNDDVQHVGQAAYIRGLL